MLILSQRRGIVNRFYKIASWGISSRLSKRENNKTPNLIEDRGFVVPLILRYRFVASSFGTRNVEDKGVAYAELLART